MVKIYMSPQKLKAQKLKDMTYLEKLRHTEKYLKKRGKLERLIIKDCLIRTRGIMGKRIGDFFVYNGSDVDLAKDNPPYVVALLQKYIHYLSKIESVFNDYDECFGVKPESQIEIKSCL